MLNPDTETQRIQEEAAYWFTVMQIEPVNAEKQKQFQEWLQHSSAHQAEYQALVQVWEAIGALSPTEVDTLKRQLPTKRPQRRYMHHLAVFAVLLLGVGVGLNYGIPYYRNGPLLYQKQYSATHQPRTVTLPDTSTVVLNVDTQLVVKYYKHKRTVILDQGEAFFQISSQLQRPFAVTAGEVTTTVTGTQFSVRHEINFVDISVLSGSVKVEEGKWWHRPQALSAEQGLRIEGKGQRVLGKRPAEKLAPWRDGKLVFINQPLVEIVEELNRYRPAQTLHIADSRLRNIRLSGVFLLSDSSAFLRSLEHIVPIATTTNSDGSQIIRLKNRQ